MKFKDIKTIVEGCLVLGMTKEEIIADVSETLDDLCKFDNKVLETYDRVAFEKMLTLIFKLASKRRAKHAGRTMKAMEAGRTGVK